MQKTAPTFGRLVVMVGFALSCFGLLLFLWLAFGGGIPFKPKGYRFTASFNEATQLAREADVRISGVPVGKVKSIELADAGRSDVGIEVERRFAPIPKNVRAILRQKTLLGETYVELTPGDRSAGMLPDGGRLGVGQISETVELDEIFRTFDPKTRRQFQTWMQTQARALDGRGQDINNALGQLSSFSENADRLLTTLRSQQGALQGTIRGTGTVFDALSARDGQLRDLVENSNRLFRTTARRDRELQRTFQALPTFNREGQQTVERLTRYAQNTNPLINQLRPAARELSPTLVDLRTVAPDLRGLFRDLDPFITASRTGLPALRGFLDDLRPVLGELNPNLQNLNPLVEFVGRYPRELTSFFANGAAAANATFDGVHYLRTTNPLLPENIAVQPQRNGSNRTNAYFEPNAYDKLGRGLDSYEVRHCGRANLRPAPASGDYLTLVSLLKGVPAEDPPEGPPLAEDFVERLDNFIFGGARTPAPPCRKQPDLPTAGSPQQRQDYPRVNADPARRAQP